MVDWELRPKQGLGRIDFGMSLEAVAQFDSIYGTRSHLHEQESAADTLAKLLAEDHGTMSEDDRRVIMEVMEETKDEALAIVRERKSSGLMLDYTANRLTNLMLCPGDTNKLSIGGVLVFEASPLEAIRDLSVRTSEVPLISGNDVVFPNHYVYFYDFLIEAEDPSLGVQEIPRDTRSEKSLIWRASPRNPKETFAGYRPITL